jgi:hypothetical protein
MSAIRHFMTVLVFAILLTGCQQDGSETAEAGGAGPEIPEILLPQRAACEKDGGRWGRVPDRETFVCYRITRDASETCSSKRDCEGLCLARSRTCAPQVPLFGCHEVLNASGLRQTLCIE